VAAVAFLFTKRLSLGFKSYVIKRDVLYGHCRHLEMLRRSLFNALECSVTIADYGV